MKKNTLVKNKNEIKYQSMEHIVVTHQKMLNILRLHVEKLYKIASDQKEEIEQLKKLNRELQDN